MTDKDIIYPIIERIVNETYLQRNAFVDRDEIAWSLLDDRIARSLIEGSLGRANYTEEQLWEKAGNYVDWLNADITAVFSHSTKWNDGYYTRKRVRRQHPFTRKMREIYALVPNVHTVSDDIGHVLSDTKISEMERAQLIQSRLGQGTFRVTLIEYWKGCAVTECKEIGILKASHIKPWRVCNNIDIIGKFQSYRIYSHALILIEASDENYAEHTQFPSQYLQILFVCSSKYPLQCDIA